MDREKVYFDSDGHSYILDPEGDILAPDGESYYILEGSRCRSLTENERESLFGKGVGETDFDKAKSLGYHPAQRYCEGWRWLIP